MIYRFFLINCQLPKYLSNVKVYYQNNNFLRNVKIQILKTYTWCFEDVTANKKSPPQKIKIFNVGKFFHFFAKSHFLVKFQSSCKILIRYSPSINFLFQLFSTLFWFHVKSQPKKRNKISDSQRSLCFSRMTAWNLELRAQCSKN